MKMNNPTLRALKALGPIDFQSVRRDELLRWLIPFPLLIGVVLRFGVPPVEARILAQFGFDISPYYGLFMSFVVMTMPLLVGMVIGFLLLDQHDDRTLTALQVTPLTLTGYLIYRISVPMLLSVLITLIVVPLANLVWIGWLPLLAATLASAPIAPLSALFLAAFAQNKVQGFALSKGSGVFLAPPLVAYFVQMPWQLLFGLTPTYWPVKLFWVLQNGEPHAWIYLVVGLAYQFLLLALLLRRFNRVMHQ